MSKAIRITEKEIEQMKQEFLEELQNAKLSDGKFTFSKKVGEVDRRAQLYFTEPAWIKQETLVREFSDEVGWHGVAKRIDDESGEDKYIIEDIMVYPQEVTGATVTTDQEKYQDWLYKQEDEVFNNIRMQGHSHVNMGVTPSGVDDSLYERILAQLEDDMFYIFLIWNKKGDKTIKIYDLAKNVLFETKDIDVSVLRGNINLNEFVEDAKSQVKKKAATTYGHTSYGRGFTSKAKSSAGKKTEKKTSHPYYSGYYSDYYEGWRGGYDY